MALSKIDVANMLTGLVPNDNTIRRPNAKPLIINGDMAISQRATSVTGLTNGSDVYVALDRFGFNEFGSPSSQHTMTQESLTSGNAYINGFANALKMDVTTAQGSLDADDATMIIYKFEGQDLQLFKKGTANAEKFTLAFWVKSTKTGTHVVELFDKDNTRHVSGTYSISTTNTWEHKVVVFPADTTGVFGDDNARSLDVSWFLSAGTNYTSGTLQTSWGGQADTTRAVGQVNTVDNTSNNWHITGVQLEVGEFTSSTLPPFQHESFGDNLARCQRYFETTFEVGTAIGASTSTGIIRSGGNQGGRTSGRMGHGFTYPVPKRSAPTVVFYDNSGNSGALARLDQGSSTASNKNATLAGGSQKSFEVTSTGDSTADCLNYHFTADAEL
jgi:hypothetical protein